MSDPASGRVPDRSPEQPPRHTTPVGIRMADLDDPRLAALVAEHHAEMEPTAPAGSRHALSIEHATV